MAKSRMGVVKLASGQGGFFDELTRIHLTVGNSIADIYSDMNLANIRRAIKSGRLTLISGTLGSDPTPFNLVPENGQYKLRWSKKPDNSITGDDAKKILAEIKEMAANSETLPAETISAEEPKSKSKKRKKSKNEDSTELNDNG